MSWRVDIGDCREVMAGLPASYFDAVVCDPPYDLTSGKGSKSGFMGKAWDGTGVAFDPATWEAVLRVLKPGGYLLAFGGSRTAHRMTCAIEDGGFEVRDVLMWLYGTGFPKSLDVSKAIDKAAEARRCEETPHPNPLPEERELSEVASRRCVDGLVERWSGFGTALKPGYEPIVLARKGLDGTVAGNVSVHGCGGLAIDGCRLDAGDDCDGSESAIGTSRTSKIPVARADSLRESGGRWPANVLLDESAAALLDGQSGELSAGNHPSVRNAAGYSTGMIQGETGNGHRLESGGASRFFYTSKASVAEREAGLSHLRKRSAGELTGREENTAALNCPRTGAGRSSGGRANHHPTVKPLDLMGWLCRLVNPPGGGRLLDPFCGSGSTLVAALREGYGEVVGIEQDAEYGAIARARVEGDLGLFSGVD